MEPVGLLVAEIDQGIVLDPGKVGTHVGRHVIVEVGWGDGDHLEVHPLTVHVRQPDRRLEDALGQGTEPLTARVAEIPATAVLDQLRTMVGMGRRHPGQSGGDDGVGVDIDRGQRRRGSIAIGTRSHGNWDVQARIDSCVSQLREGDLRDHHLHLRGMPRLPLDRGDGDDLNGDLGSGVGNGPAQLALHPIDEIRRCVPTGDDPNQELGGPVDDLVLDHLRDQGERRTQAVGVH